MDEQAKSFFNDHFSSVHQAVGRCQADIAGLATRVDPVCKEFEYRSTRRERQRDFWKVSKEKAWAFRAWILAFIALTAAIPGMKALAQWISSSATH